MLAFLFGPEYASLLGVREANNKDAKTTVQSVRNTSSASPHHRRCKSIGGKERHERSQRCADVSVLYRNQKPYERRATPPSKTWNGAMRAGTNGKEWALAPSDTTRVMVQGVPEQPEAHVKSTEKRRHTHIPHCLPSWTDLQQRLLYESNGKFRPWMEATKRRISSEYARTRASLFHHEVQGRRTIVVTVDSRCDSIQVVLRHFLSIEDDDKEMVAVEIHATAPTACLVSQAHQDERFMLIPLRLDPSPGPDFGKAVGALMASGQYIIEATVKDLLDAESRQMPVTMTHPYYLRKKRLQVL